MRPSASEGRRARTETLEKTIPEITQLADNDLQWLALQRLGARTQALREGLAKLSEQLSNRTELLRNTIDAAQTEAMGAIDNLSVKMRQREQRAQETFDRTLADISRQVLSIAVIFLGIITAFPITWAISSLARRKTV
jgi:Fe2+ transport system protein B